MSQSLVSLVSMNQSPTAQSPRLKQVSESEKPEDQTLDFPDLIKCSHPARPSLRQSATLTFFCYSGRNSRVSSPMFCHCLGPALKIVPCIDWVYPPSRNRTTLFLHRNSCSFNQIDSLDRFGVNSYCSMLERTHFSSLTSIFKFPLFWSLSVIRR